MVPGNAFFFLETVFITSEWTTYLLTEEIAAVAAHALRTRRREWNGRK